MKFVIMTLMFGTFAFSSSAMAAVGGKSCGNLEQARVIKSCSSIQNDSDRSRCLKNKLQLEDKSEATAQRPV